MGKIKSGILGGFSGTVGPVVGRSWKGISVMQSKPPSKRRRSTDAQLRQMAKLRLMTPFVSPLTGLLNKTYVRAVQQMSCFNKAMSYNMRNAIIGDYPDFRINYPLVVLGVGDLLNPFNVSVQSDAEGQIRFAWPDNGGVGSARVTDKAFVAIYCEDSGRWLTRSGGTTEKCRQLHIRCNCIQRQSGAHLYRVLIRRCTVCVYQPLCRFGEHTVITTYLI